MKKQFSISKVFLPFIVLLFTIILIHSLNAQVSLDMKDYTAEMIQHEYQTIMKKLGNKDGIGGPNAQDRTQILRTKAWGVSAVEKTIWDAEGVMTSYDVYGMKNGELIWEHQEFKKTSVHFMITIAQDGTLSRKDLTVVAVVPTKTPPAPTQIPIPSPTVSPTESPEVTPVVSPTLPDEITTVSTPVPEETAGVKETPVMETPVTTPVLPTLTPVPPKPTPTRVPPTPIPIKEKVIFVSNRNGNLDIYTMNVDGSDVEQITFSASNEAYPCVSPDGKKIAFASNRDGNWEIYVMDYDGKEDNAVRLTFNNTDDLYPSFTADSKHVVFQSNRDGNSELYMVDIIQPRKQERLTVNEADDIHPRVFKEVKN